MAIPVDCPSGSARPFAACIHHWDSHFLHSMSFSFHFIFSQICERFIYLASQRIKFWFYSSFLSFLSFFLSSSTPSFCFVSYPFRETFIIFSVNKGKQEKYLAFEYRSGYEYLCLSMRSVQISFLLQGFSLLKILNNFSSSYRF